MTFNDSFLFVVGMCIGFFIREYLSGLKLPHTISEVLRKDEIKEEKNDS